MRAYGERFDHNLHALRIVESFEQRYARFPGLNLSFEVREGMVKHSSEVVPGANPLLDRFLPGRRPVLEAQLIDLADEVAYNTADLDDAWSAGLIAAGEIAGAVPAYREIHDAMETQFPGATPRERFYEALRHLVDVLVSGLIEGTVGAARAAGVETPEQVREWSHRLAAFTPETADASRDLKRFLYAHVYSSPALGSDRQRSMEAIATLFAYFVQDPTRLPDGYAGRVREEPAHQVICDYIAGMTDGYFNRVYRDAIA